MTPERIWYLSSRLYRARLVPLAKLLKSLNFLLFGASLPYEVDVPRDVVLWHRGHGTVIHPATKIGAKVRIAHNATVSAGDWHEDTDLGVVIEDGVTLAVGCSVIPKEGDKLTIGAGAIIGAHALVIADVPAGAVVRSAPGEVVERATAGR